MKLTKLGRKATSYDHFYIVIALFGMLILATVTLYAWSLIRGIDEVWTGSSIGTTIRGNVQAYYDNMDFILIMLYFGLHLGVIVAAFLLRTYPVLFIIAIPLTAVLIIVSSQLSNVGETLYATFPINETITQLPMSQHIWNNIVLYESVWAIVIAIVTFGMGGMFGRGQTF